MNSLRSRLIAVMLTLLTLLAVATGIASLNAIKEEQAQQSRQAVAVATRVFAEALHNQAQTLTNSVRLLASDFGFRQAVALREQDTIASVLDNHSARINAGLAILLSPAGEMLATNRGIAASELTPFFAKAQQNPADAITDIVYVDHHAYQLVMVPVKAPLLIGWVVMGFELTEQLAQQIKQLTEVDISFTAQHDSRLEILASTLDSPAIALSGNLMQQQDREWLASAWLNSNIALGPDITAWLHLSTEHYQRSYHQIRTQLLLVFGFGLTLALLLAIWFARSIALPLQLLSRFAQAIGVGQPAERPQVKGAEVQVLASTLDKMQSDIREREQQIRYQSQHDNLTGLVNRSYVEQHLPALLNQQQVQLLLVNIKDFRHINDVFGYQNGDSLLQQLAERLRQTKPITLLARLGNDEFLMVVPANLAVEEFLLWQQQWSQHFMLGASMLNLKLALAHYQVLQPQDHNDALRRVDIAMVHAKLAPALFASYQAGQDESHQRELTLLHDLPNSLLSGEMFVVYQPKVALQSKQVQSAEALIRWQHPRLGFIPPDEFIKLAEHAGLISQVTNWMIAHVIAQIATWQQQALDICVAVNLSAWDLLNPELPNQIQQLLDEHQVSPNFLALEVTEGAVMQDPAQVIQNLQILRSMGISLAIDDFGTGQSSLAYMKRLPVHEVKIDRAFVKDIEHSLNDQLIVQTTRSLAHGLGLKVTAEGLENTLGLAHLQHAGVDTVQGYFFSKPLPAAGFLSWVQQFRQDATPWFGESS